MSEEETLASGQARIKFSCKRIGHIWELVEACEEKEKVKNLAKILAEMLLNQEKHGFAPVAPDGFVGGNGALVVNIANKDYVLVSKSGKLPKEMNYQTDFCLISDFDIETWSCDYYSTDESIRPTSDAPMHYRLLKGVQGAKAAIHGHAIQDEASAKRKNIPCSTTETLFSTLADTEAMFELLEQYPYPNNKIFVRKNHGFYILGDDLEDVERVLMTNLVDDQEVFCRLL